MLSVGHQPKVISVVPHACETHNQDSNSSYYCFCFELSLVSLGFQNSLQCFTLVFISFSLSYFNVFGFIHL